jgi:glycosyltransferase involved in cell wall biosynthesis
MARRLIVDDRWRGDSGIARFSREVLARLRLPHGRLEARVPPLGLRDVLLPARAALGSQTVLYSPGFNAGPSRALQIVTIHDLIHLADPSESSAAKRLYYERVLRRVVRAAGTVLTVSNTSRLAIEEWIDDEDVHVVDVGNGLSEAFTRPAAALPGRAARDCRFLFIGDARPHKNLTTALRLVARRRAARLTVVASDVDAVRLLARRHGADEQVEVVSRLSDEQLRDLYVRATALLFPSRLEGFGLPVLEALASGTPVLYWGGCRSAAEIAGDAGYRVEDAADLEEWLAGMDAAAAGRLEVSAEVAEQLRRRYSWDGVAARVQTVLAAASGM